MARLQIRSTSSSIRPRSSFRSHMTHRCDAICSRSSNLDRSGRDSPAISHRSTADPSGPSTCWSISIATFSKAISYVIRLDPGVQELERTLELASGSCRDTTWLLVATVPPSRARRALRVRLPDPAGSGRESARRTVRRRPRLYRSARLVRSPIYPAPAGSDSTRRRVCSRARGTFRCRAHPSRHDRRSGLGGVEACEVDFVHEMSVRRIVESPRVTKPYTDEQWAMILACGVPRGR